MDPTVRAILLWSALTAAVMIWGGLLYLLYSRASSKLLSGIQIRPKMRLEEQEKREEFYFVSVRSFEAEESLALAAKALNEKNYEKAVNSSYDAASKLVAEIAGRAGIDTKGKTMENLIEEISAQGRLRINLQAAKMLARIVSKDRKSKSDAVKALNLASTLIRDAREIRVEPPAKTKPVEEGNQMLRGS